jgi:hypothetical protein
LSILGTMVGGPPRQWYNCCILGLFFHLGSHFRTAEKRLQRTSPNTTEIDSLVM